ncbi:MAG: S41 family peptidase [Bacteroidota bacterium]
MKLVGYLLLTLLLSCSSLTEKKIPSKADLSGFWEQQGEGEIVEFKDSLVIFYNSNSFNCYPYWKMSREEFNTDSPTVQIVDETTFTNQEGYTILTYKKVDKPAVICTDLTEEQIASNSYNFETIWHTFNDQYAFFEERKVDWEEVKTRYQARFTEETSPFEFYLLLEEMVLELGDEHSDFVVPDEFEEQWDQVMKDSDADEYRGQVKDEILEKYVSDVQMYNGNQLVWGDISDRIAYVQFNGMDGLADYQPTSADDYWEAAEESDDYEQDLFDGTHTIATRIVNDIQDSEACIIDLRFNSGGYDQVGLAFLSHFIDQEYEVFKKKRRLNDSFSDYQIIDIKPSKPSYLKKVYVLMSPFTVSAAETTIIASRQFPNFTWVGSNTAGALSDMLYKRLPNGWLYHLSNEVYETMDGQVFEVGGINPHYLLDYPREEEELFRSLLTEVETQDRAIEKVKALVQ